MASSPQWKESGGRSLGIMTQNKCEVCWKEITIYEKVLKRQKSTINRKYFKMNMPAFMNLIVEERDLKSIKVQYLPGVLSQIHSIL